MSSVLAKSTAVLSGEAAEQALEEYKSLRTEVLQHEKACTELLGFTLAFTGVVFGLGIANRTPGIFLVALPLLWAMYYYITDKRRAAHAAAQYIAVFLEPSLPGLNRETRRMQLKLKQRVLPGERGIVVDSVVFNGLYTASLVLFVYYDGNRYAAIIPAMIWAGLKCLEFIIEKPLGRLDQFANLRARDLWRSSAVAPADPPGTVLNSDARK